MEQWIVVSDSHGDSAALSTILKAQPNATGLIHLGDGLADLLTVDTTQLQQQYYVVGNNDYMPNIHETFLLERQGIRLFGSHGHRFAVKQGLYPLAQEAAQQQANIALFGHTHHALWQPLKDIALLNPGSACRANNNGNIHYAILTLSPGNLAATLCVIKGDL